METLTVTNQWKIVVKGLDDRYHEVFIDPQGDFMHARRSAQAYLVEDPGRPAFVPDARVIREGAVVGLLDALRALVQNQGPAELTLAKEAILAAVDPNFDTRLKDVDAVTLESIARAGKEGGEAFQAGTSKAMVPERYEAEGQEVLADAWKRGWEAEFIQRSNIGRSKKS